MSVSITVDTTGFTAACAHIAKLSKASMRDVIAFQCGKILEICVKRSPGKAPNPERKKAIRLRIQKPTRYISAIGTIVPKNGNVPRDEVNRPLLQTLTGTKGGTEGGQWWIYRAKRKDGRPIIINPMRKRPRDYDRFESARQALAGQLAPKSKDAIAAIGSLKKSWLQIADRLGVSIKVMGFVRKARTPFDDGQFTTFVEKEGAVYAEMVNTNGMLIQKFSGASILQGAINQRLSAFRHEVRTGVFDDLVTRAQRYPGLFVS